MRYLSTAALALLTFVGFMFGIALLLRWMPGFFAFAQSLITREYATPWVALPRAFLFAAYLYSLWRVARAAWRSGRGTAAPGEAWKSVALGFCAYLACWAALWHQFR